jgi:hypothetical protein
VASPLDSLRTLKKGNQLSATSEEELQNLSRAAGRSAVPTTPLEAGVLGANPDVAKMAGSSSSLITALRQSVKDEDDLQTASRTQQARKVQTDEERAQQQKGREFGGLGSLDSRVEELRASILAGSGQASAPQALAVNHQAVASALPPGSSPETQSQAVQLLAKIGEGTATSGDLLAAARLFGISSVADLPTLEKQLRGAFLSQSEQAANTIATSTADQITVGTLTPEQFATLGFEQGPDELAQLLGITPEQLQQLTVKQLGESVRGLQSKEFLDVQQLQAVLSDPMASRAEKEQARRLLQEAGAVGTRASESDFDSLAKQVEDANTVEFAGESYTTEELLADSFLSSLVKDYLENPAEAARLKQLEPDFAAFIERNKAALEKAAQELDGDIQQFAAVQKANQEAARLPTGQSLSDRTMSALYSDWGQLRDSAYEEKPLLGVLKNQAVPEPLRVELAQGLETIANLDSGTARELADMGLPELQAVGATEPGALKNYTDYVQQIRTIQELGPEAIWEAAFSPEERQAMEKMLQTAGEADASGLVSPPADGLVASLKGKTDDPRAVYQAVMQGLTGGSNRPLSLREMLQGGVRAGNLPTVSKALENDRRALDQSTNDSLFQKVRGLWDDGRATQDEVRAVLPALSLEETSQLQDRAQNLVGGAGAVLTAGLEQKAKERLNEKMVNRGMDSKRLYDLSMQGPRLSLEDYQVVLSFVQGFNQDLQSDPSLQNPRVIARARAELDRANVLLARWEEAHPAAVPEQRRAKKSEPLPMLQTGVGSTVIDTIEKGFRRG